MHEFRRHHPRECFRCGHGLNAGSDRYVVRIAVDCREWRQQHLDLEFDERDFLHRLGRLERIKGCLGKSKHRRVECQFHIHTQLHR